MFSRFLFIGHLFINSAHTNEKFKQAKLNFHYDDYIKRNHAEIQRRFIDLQFKRSELENQLNRVNEVLFSLGKEMEELFAYDQFYK